MKGRPSGSVMLLLLIALDTCVGGWSDGWRVGSLQGWLYLLLRATTAIVTLRRGEPIAIDSRAWVTGLCVWSSVLEPYAAYWLASPVRGPAASAGDAVLLFASLLTWRSIVALDRSFGVRPAHRELVMTGPYRLIRHPLYAAYVLSDVAFLLLSPTLTVALLTASGWAAFGVRMKLEEQVLACDRSWSSYASAVPYRLCPYLL